jgi:two-component system cell cycle response regulator
MQPMSQNPQGARRERILLVEDSATQAQRTRLVLEAAHFVVEVCDRGTVALASAAANPPDLVLLDLYLPDLSGREVAQRLKADPTLSGIPIIFLTGVFRDVADIVTGLESGADDYLRKPIEDGELVARVRACLRTRQTQRELGRLARLMLTVNQIGGQISGILQLDTLLASVVVLIQENFDYPYVHLFLLDDSRQALVLAAAAGPSAGELMANPPRLPLDSDSLAATSARHEQLVAPFNSRGMLHPFLPEVRSGAAAPLHSAGGVSGVLEIVSPQELAFSSNDGLVLQTLADLVGVAVNNSRLYRQMEDLAMVDELTGLLNRRTLIQRLEAEWGRSQRYKRPLSLVLLDVDFFKQVNDRYGHGTGDEALTAVARLIEQSVRRVDAVGRLGGDEFLLVLPETPHGGAMEVAARLAARSRNMTIASDKLPAPTFTFSLGVASWPEVAASGGAELLQAADQALYRAKAAGRNRVGT